MIISCCPEIHRSIFDKSSAGQTIIMGTIIGQNHREILGELLHEGDPFVLGGEGFRLANGRLEYHPTDVNIKIGKLRDHAVEDSVVSSWSLSAGL